MKIINLTPHTINYYVDGVFYKSFEPSGLIAKVNEFTIMCGVVDDLRMVGKRYSEVEGLPIPSKYNEEPKMYIVSDIVKAAVNYRNDVIAPDTGSGAVKNEQGHIIGISQFIWA